MDERQKIYLACGIGGLGLLMLLVATARSCRSGPDPGGFQLPAATYWICRDLNCHTTFSIRRSDLTKYQKAHPQSPTPPCPKCGKNNAAAATKCPHCGTVYPSRGSVPGIPVCPNCNKPAMGPA